MNPSKAEAFNSETTGVDILATLGGIAVGFGVLPIEYDYLWNIDQGRATVKSINRQEANIRGLQVGESTFRSEPEPLRSEAESVLSHRLDNAKAELHATIEHNPIFAGGQDIEAIGLTYGGLFVFATLGYVASKKIRRLVHNHRNAQSDRQESSDHQGTPQTSSFLPGFKEIVAPLKF